MISLSKIIKSHWTVPSFDDAKMISIKSISKDDPDELTVEKTIDQVREEQNQLVKASQEEADRIIQEAQRYQEEIFKKINEEQQLWIEEQQRLKEQAFEEGYQAGIEAGRQQGYAEMQENIQVAQSIVETMKTEFDKHLEKAERVILELGITSAEKILGELLTEEPERFLPIVKRGLKEVRELPEVQIHIHPSNFQLLQSNKEELESIFPAVVQCYIYPNDELQPTDCYIESNQGRVMVSVDSQLKELKVKLEEMLEGDSI